MKIWNHNINPLEAQGALEKELEKIETLLNQCKGNFESKYGREAAHLRVQEHWNQFWPSYGLRFKRHMLVVRCSHRYDSSAKEMQMTFKIYPRIVSLDSAPTDDVGNMVASIENTIVEFSCNEKGIFAWLDRSTNEFFTTEKLMQVWFKQLEIHALNKES